MRLLVAVLLILAGPASAQSRGETLADIRQQLSVLYVQVQDLKRELSTTGSPMVGGGGGSVLDRMAALEAELQRLTAKSEELENRIDRVVSDGTNRIEDLEFRLCELETGCDVSKLSQGTTLGGGPMPGAASGASQAPASGGAVAGGGQAVGEQSDFDRAKAAYDAGDFAGAAGLFQSFTQTYTAGPLYSQAHYWRGEALARQGNTQGAAQAFLDSFSGAPNGPVAPQSLLRLGQLLGELGQRQEACVTLSEVGTRFAGTPSAGEAVTARQSLGCQ